MFKSMLGAVALVIFGASICSAAERKLAPPEVSETLSYAHQKVDVLESEMAYLDVGEGEPVLFIHGNPTSSYLWRNIIPFVSDQRRAIAVDLIGMGASGKPDIAYTYADHYAYLSAFIDALDLSGITLVVHDWGAALGWDYARQNPGRVKRIAFMEGVLPPAFPSPGFEGMGDVGAALKAMRDPVQGHQMVVVNNMFVEQMLPSMVNRPLGDLAMAAYRAPFASEADRKPVLEWPRQLPIGGEPQHATQVLNDVTKFMQATDMPTLLLYAEPGVLVPPSAVDWYAGHMKNLETVFVGQGFHFIQEDQPVAIGRALRDWLRRH